MGSGKFSPRDPYPWSIVVIKDFEGHLGHTSILTIGDQIYGSIDLIDTPKPPEYGAPFLGCPPTLWRGDVGATRRPRGGCRSLSLRTGKRGVGDLVGDERSEYSPRDLLSTINVPG